MLLHREWGERRRLGLSSFSSWRTRRSLLYIAFDGWPNDPPLRGARPAARASRGPLAGTRSATVSSSVSPPCALTLQHDLGNPNPGSGVLHAGLERDDFIRLRRQARTTSIPAAWTTHRPQLRRGSLGSTSPCDGQLTQVSGGGADRRRGSPSVGHRRVCAGGCADLGVPRLAG